MVEKLLTTEELAEELRTPVSWVYSRTRMKGERVIPMVRVGKYIRFRLSSVLEFLEQEQQNSNHG